MLNEPCIDTRRLVIPSLRSLHPQLVEVWNQPKGLDGINPKERYTPARDAMLVNETM